MNNFEHKMSNL